MECPNCRSKRINILPWLGIIYQCENCGYRGPIVLEKRKISKKS